MPSCTFFVAGDPAAQGSKRLVRLRNGRSVMLEQSQKVKPWRAAVAATAREHDCPTYPDFVRVIASVQFLRPAGHYRKDGTVKPSTPRYPGYADVDKLARALLDGLAGVAYGNDRQVAQLSLERAWAPPGEQAGAWVTIFPLST